MKQRFRKCLGAMIPALMLGAPLLASSARSISRLRARTVAVKSEVASGETGEAAYSASADPFAVFGNGAKPEVVEMGGGAGSEVLEFLKSNNLLRGERETASALSGELDGSIGRKDFAGTNSHGKCVLSWGTYYSDTNTHYGNPAVCASWSGTWVPGTTAPTFEDISVTNKTSTSFNLNADLSKSGTVYAVLLLSTASVPNSNQVKNGTDGSGNPAMQAKNVVATTSPYIGTISFTGLDAGTDYRVYVVGYDATNGITPTPEAVDPTFAFGNIFKTTSSYVYPKIAATPNGNFYMAFWDNANARYTVDKWNMGTWAWASYASFTKTDTGTYNLTWGSYDGTDFTANSPNASTDNLHMVYSTGPDQWGVNKDPYLALHNGSGWSFTMINNEATQPGNFNIFVDGNGKDYVAYNYENGASDYLFYETNASTAFPHASTSVKTNNAVAAGNLEMGKTILVRESGGTLHLFYGSEQNPWWTGYYRADSSDNFATKSVTLVLDSCPDGGCPDDSSSTGRVIWQLGNAVTDSSNNVHMVYSDTTNKRAYYYSNRTGSWVSTQITSTGRTNLSAIDVKVLGSTVYVAMRYEAGLNDYYYYLKAFDGTNWYDGKLFRLNGSLRQFAIDPVTQRVMIASEGYGPYQVNYKTGLISDFVTVVSPDTTPPTVSSIIRANADNTNVASVGFTVTLSESVTGVDTADFSLIATGTASGTIASVTGSGATYTVTVNGIAGVGTLRLDLKSSGTGIADGASNPISGGFTSGQTYTVDRVASTVINVTSSVADGTYTTGKLIPITVTFSENVTVSGGPPQLSLETGTTDAVADYVGGSGTTNLTFNYTIAAGEASADLDYISTTALALNGGTIRDTALNDADLTLATPGTAGSLGTNKAIVVTPTLGVSALVLSGTNVYAGQDGAGIWRSTDSGATWSAATTQPANLRIKGVVIHPSDAVKLFAASYGSGVFTSSNSGDSWSSCVGQPANLNAVSLAIDGGGRLYAGTEGGIFTSSDCTSWSAVNTGLTVDAAKPPVAIAVDPVNAANLYAGLDGAGVFRSSNGGATWTSATTQPSNLRVKELVIKPGGSSKQFAATYGAGIFTSTDSGDTWSACANTGLTNLNVVSLTIDSGGKLYAGTEAGVFRSTDNCATWSAINDGLP